MISYKFLFLLIISVINLLFCSNASGKDTSDVVSKFLFYKNKFKVSCADEKITDNFGNGYDSLYGTRNMRVILHGVAYRGGANNYYNKILKRDNHNPLPPEGLINLVNQGFSKAIYLYSKNFNSSEKIFVNDTGTDTLHYLQNSGMKRNDLKAIMLMVLEVIKNKNIGPIYLHCWNGWHQSGYISAAILMQFCGLTNEQALKYWNQNTDGVNKGYENVKRLVSSFVPFNDIKIDDKTRNTICPCLESK
mgnify:CR=1 FL=1